MSPISHSAIGLLGWQITSSPKRKNIKTLLLFILVSNFPDFDIFLLLIPATQSKHIHQTYTHNLMFVLITAFLFSLFLPSTREKLGLVFAGLSHLVLDIFVVDTFQPVGFRLFYPFSRKLFKFGFFPYLERGDLHKWLSAHNLFVLSLEAVVFLLPVIFFYRKELAATFRKKEFWKI
jgi:membrane-bound metal-dependent hydrolase YbcI (DUF457 family)